VRWACQDRLLSLLKLADAFIPSANNLAKSNLELKGLSSGDTRVEDGTVVKFARVVDLDVGALRHNRAGTLVQLLNDKLLHLNEALSDEFVNLVRVCGHAGELINQVSVTDEVDHGDALDLQ